MGLGVLNLSDNKLEGLIPNVFPTYCRWSTLDLNGNLIEGEVPKSLVSCSQLEVLDLGNNQLTGKFPCFLRSISILKVLIIRSNKFYGSVKCSNTNQSWLLLQIFDLAHNSFSGKLPGQWFTKSQAMTANPQAEVLEFINQFKGTITFGNGKSFTPLPIFYWYRVTVNMKGQEMELPKILTIFASIDLSSNRFHGPIPGELGQLQALHILNLSANALINEIPSSMGNMQQLESLDLSWNNLSGAIPTSLQRLSFLSFLNLSFNQPVGSIPTGG